MTVKEKEEEEGDEGGRMSAVAKSLSKTTANTANHIRRSCARWPHKTPVLKEVVDNDTIPKISAEHDLPLGSWSTDAIRDAAASSMMMTWNPGKAKTNLPIIKRGKGVYVYDDHDKQYLDWTSMAVCTNLGHSPPSTIVNATLQQLDTIPFCYGGIAMTEIRARMSKLMSDILPGDLQGMVFPSSGAEANEAAIMMARRYTGKYKVINWYRSYHGGTSNSLQATGDSRRWLARAENPGFVKSFNPYPLFFDYKGDTEAERTQMALNMLEEQVLNEGPETIALIQFESIVGSGGVIIPPEGYMQGVRAICDKYDILMHCDEVMVGFGRTGKLFGFQNFEGVIPDIVTCAKGITSSFVPLSMTACRKHIMEKFEEQTIGWGSTYQAHPVALACGYETVKYILQNDVLENVQQLAPIVDQKMKELAEKHPCIKQYRCIGLFGCFDTHLPNGENPQLQHEAVHQAFVAYKKAFAENGLIGLVRPPHLHVAPPLIITEEELLDGFERQDKALTVLDKALGF